ncbi:MAG: T9SS type A sorting domain-containing protein, partial [Melioribacteraceae bacterium]|nr:T9SS type A sorting domain-containing protein [Melioribacteraceae bacterium]
DDLDHMIINQGWAGNGGHHGGEMFADSLFCQILEVYPQNIPNDNGMNIIAGYEVNMFNPDGSSAMLSGGMMGGHMSFTSAVNYQLHYTDEQMNYLNVDESTVEAKYWDNQSNNWVTVSTSLDPQNNTVSFESSEVSNFIILTADQATSVDGDYDQAIVTDFILKQNYPNPFNPATIIEFDLNEKSYVVISIYNLLGEKLFELNNGILSAGNYKLNFDASSLTSGIYFYQLRTGKNIVTKKMDLLK